MGSKLFFGANKREVGAEYNTWETKGDDDNGSWQEFAFACLVHNIKDLSNYDYHSIWIDEFCPNS